MKHIKDRDRFVQIKYISDPGTSGTNSSSDFTERSMQTGISDEDLYRTHLKMASDVGLFKTNFSSKSSCGYGK